MNSVVTVIKENGVPRISCKDVRVEWREQVFLGQIYQDEDGFFAKVLGCPFCTTAGETEKQIVERLTEALSQWLEVFAEDGGALWEEFQKRTGVVV